MPKAEKNLKGIYGAIRNKPTARRPRTDPRTKDNHRCLAVECDQPVYWDGEIWYSLCLGCLKEMHLGPFRKRVGHVVEDDWPDRGCCSGSLVANALMRKESLK